MIQRSHTSLKRSRIRRAAPKPRVWADGRVRLSMAGYKKLRKQVYREQNNRCAPKEKGGCGRRVDFAHFQLDHKKLRGMGGGNRDDRRENVIGLCAGCHEEKHRPKPCPPKPERGMAADKNLLGSDLAKPKMFNGFPIREAE